MSRLWPDALHAGLFPGHCWLRKGSGKDELLAGFAGAATASDMLQGLEQCLIQSQDKRKGRLDVSILVSDCVAAIAPLPWQDGLSSEAELQGYAQICFEKLGYEIGTNWVTRVEYLRYGSPGMAYAMPRDWMESLLEKLQAQRIHLVNILPVSAQVFCGGLIPAKKGLTVVLVIESTQQCTLMFRNGHLLSRDVQPFAQSIEKTCHRLLARVLSNQNTADKDALNLLWWSSQEIDCPDAAIKAYISEGNVTAITKKRCA